MMPSTIADGLRRCALCGKDKPLKEFYRYKGYKGRTYYLAYCRPCARAETKRRYREDRRCEAS